ncbi:hypothetical protein BE17_05645 [Sorangium cellulosum]|uniref:Uncharacterized protein n=1 Tax=Sorangium cellulosum TaxID=56 RepID=A0A150RZS9_SORCE|nr:hypothetical protein BE17_05645 [Sorangium cellulosum]
MTEGITAQADSQSSMSVVTPTRSRNELLRAIRYDVIRPEGPASVCDFAVARQAVAPVPAG